MSRLALILVALGASACTGQAPVNVTQSFVPGTPSSAGLPLSVSLSGEPMRTFIVHGGKWRICDHGTVMNTTSLTAPDVRVVVTYIDHGTMVGMATRDDAATDGGALGDIPPGGSRDFTVCGLASAEPDSDEVNAVPAGVPVPGPTPT